MALVRKLVRANGKPIEGKGMVAELEARTKAFQNLPHPQRVKVFAPMLAKEQELAARGRVTRPPGAVGGDGGPAHGPQAEAFLKTLPTLPKAITKSMTMPKSSFKEFGAYAPKTPWSAPSCKPPSCAGREHVWYGPDSDGYIVCGICSTERGASD